MIALTWPPVRRLLARHRRLCAAVCAGAAAWLAIGSLSPPRAATVAVLTAARELPPGATLSLRDLRAVQLPAALVPAGALRPGAAVLGRLVAGAVRRGEPLTDVRLVGAPLLTAAGLPAGAVAVPVRLADPGAAALLHAGERVDVLASGADGEPGPARVLAERVLVLAVPGAGSGGGPDGGGGLVVVGCTPEVARAIAAAGGARLSVAVRGAPP